MICCFMNFHEGENTKDLAKHLEKEIEIAVGRGCSVFICGNKRPEDDIFAETVEKISKYYAEGEVVLKRMDKTEEELKNIFIDIADWEIYPFEG